MSGDADAPSRTTQGSDAEVGPPTIAVTGAAGYIGSRVLVRLRDAHPDWELVALDNGFRSKVDAVGDVAIDHVDVRDRRRLDAALEGADVVIHLAAVSGVDDCDEHSDLAYEVNVTGTSNVAWFCRRTGAGLIFPFSMAVVGDPETFPIPAHHERAPMNWYGRTKLLGEDIVRDFADGAFPAHLFFKSNLYGEHEVDGRTVTKPTVINFFVNRAFSDEPLTVYEPGTQARNYVHIDDVARAYVLSVERLLAERADGRTGATVYPIASDEDPSVMMVARLVELLAREEADVETDVQLVENPRSGETLVEEFPIDVSRTRADLGWEPTRTVDESVRRLIRKKVEEVRATP